MKQWNEVESILQTCNPNYIKRSSTRPMADIDSCYPHGARLHIYQVSPFVLQFDSFPKDERDKCFQVLHGKCRRCNATLAFVCLAFCCQHTATNQAAYQFAGLPRFLIY